MTAINLSEDDLSAFHATHFSTLSTDHFSEQFLGPVEETYQEDEDEEGVVDDGLGYYADGTKRTLIDEQIAIFRHSEIETLLRDRRHLKEARDSTEKSVSESAAEEGEVEDGEIGDDSPTIELPTPPPSNNDRPIKKQTKKEKKAQHAKERGFFKQHVKPDLRKRTWDKVETGLGNLDYDEMENSGISALSRPSQRRRISYGDD